jgi:translation initiation factor IF-1
MAREERDDRIEFEGIVDEVMPGTMFRVKVSDNHMVLCTLSGKMRQHKIRVLLGDRVRIEVSPYDLTRGRLSRRL